MDSHIAALDTEQLNFGDTLSPVRASFLVRVKFGNEIMSQVLIQAMDVDVIGEGLIGKTCSKSLLALLSVLL